MSCLTVFSVIGACFKAFMDLNALPVCADVSVCGVPVHEAKGYLFTFKPLGHVGVS